MNEAVAKVVRGVAIGLVVVGGGVLLLVLAPAFFGRGNAILPNDGRGMMYPSTGAGVTGGAAVAPDAVGTMPSQKMALGAPVAFDTNGGVADVVTPDRKVIKDGSLDLRVRNADETVDRIRIIAEAAGGSVFASSFTQSANALKTGVITVRVPVDRFEETFAELKKVATLVVSEGTSGADVTNQYIDLAARLKSLQAEEQAYQNLLGQAQKVSDILEITQQLSTVRGEIESLQGQLRSLASQTDLASISVSVTEDPRIAGDQSFRPLAEFRAAVSLLLQELGRMGTNLITFLIVAAPILGIYGLILWGIFLGVRWGLKRFL